MSENYDITTRRVTEEEFDRIEKVARPLVNALREAESIFGPGTSIQAITMIATEIVMNARMRPGHTHQELAEHICVAIRKSVEVNVKAMEAAITARNAGCK